MDEISYEILGDLGVDDILQLAEHGRDLTHTIGTVVEEEERVTICAVSPDRNELNTSHTFDATLFTIDDNGLQELVCDILPVVFLNHVNDAVLALAILTNAINETLDGDLDTFPALITVHGIVPANDSGKLSIILLFHEVQQIFQVFCGRPRSGVTTITKEVDIGVGHSNLFCGLEKGE